MVFRSAGANNVSSIVLKSEDTPPLYVPRDFVGASCNSVPAPAAGTVYGAARNWDFRGIVPPGGTPAGRYMASMKGLFWDGATLITETLDRLVQNNPGKTLHFCLGCPADWMVTRAAVGSAAYGGKDNMVPDLDDAHWGDPLRALCQYLKANGYKAENIVFDSWNEIDLNGFLHSTERTRLADYVPYTAGILREQFGAGVRLLAPCTNTQPDLLATVLAYSDGKGGKLADYCTGGGGHTYHLSGTVANAVRIFYESNLRFFKALADGGVKNAEFHMTECGVDKTYFYAPRLHTVRMLICAAMGVRTYMAYTWDHATFGFADFAAQWNDAAAYISGRNIQYAAMEQAGQLVMVVDNDRRVISMS